MNIITAIILVVAYCVIPAGVLWLCRKVRWIGKIGPILILYFLGAIIANIGVLLLHQRYNEAQNIFEYNLPRKSDMELNVGYVLYQTVKFAKSTDAETY